MIELGWKENLANLYLNDILLVEQEVLELLRVSLPGPVGICHEVPHGDAPVRALVHQLLDVSVQVGPVADVLVAAAHPHLALISAGALLDVQHDQHLLVRVYSRLLKVFILDGGENVDGLQQFDISRVGLVDI